MVKYLVIIFTLIFEIVNSQIVNPFEGEKCANFSYSTKSTGTVKIEFLNQEIFKLYETKKVNFEENKYSENTELLNEFKLKFPKVFKDSCAKFNSFFNNKLTETKTCNVKFLLVDKKSNFFIFKVSGFEIAGFLIFNEKNNISIFTDEFPQILDDGKYILSFHNGINYTTVQLYKKHENEYNYSEINITPKYRIANFFAYKDYFENLILVPTLVSKNLILVEESKIGKKYGIDENNGCKVLMHIEF
ncbi:hypothetical protein [Kaistella jeonii]|uniref:Uncharacterized protein n=2 Tax=Kaistella jeonii TaxID=266749 RepID=A0A0C1F797_9FLAO|nr:hypothetical protein [Kaistella jeonii]KIA83954.1 hypothetical protein OA86_14950 [Kaistella jeonii]SFC43224.1 hypothetical protein SAMN05421876_1229 [Kaistella jeonii]VEI96534.1 Uncharacterised protein [Kaistella jeonii]